MSSDNEVTEGLRDACGVFGVVASEWPTKLDISNLICLGLVGLQHRGQESAGIVTSKGDDKMKFQSHKGMGLVNQVFNEYSMQKLKGANLGIGHTRYSTAGGSEVINCQPFTVETSHGLLSIAHNGELVNGPQLKQKIMKHGIGLTAGSDTEVIVHLLAHTPPDIVEDDGPNWPARILHFMKHSWLSYSLVLMYKDVIYAIRDPFGNRPLCLGKLFAHHTTNSSQHHGHVEDSVYYKSDSCDGWIVSSESCSFHSIGAEFYREVLPGEIVKLTKDGVESVATFARPENKLASLCIFEYVYFARPDSYIEGQQVYSVRKRCGEVLALESPADADLVATLPESATPAAMGYAEKSGLPYVEVLTKNRYIGRTFIQPSNRLRRLGVTKKFGALSENFKGKRIVLVDDSIVRGNTMTLIVKLLKSSGAKEVHVRIASPPLHHPCYMGINIPTREELIANRMSMEDLALQMNADSLKYMSVEGLVKAVRGDESRPGALPDMGHCTACLTGNYPVELEW